MVWKLRWAFKSFSKNEMVPKSSRYTLSHNIFFSISDEITVPPFLPETTASVGCYPFYRKPPMQQLSFSPSGSNTRPANLDHQHSSSFSFPTVGAKHREIEGCRHLRFHLHIVLVTPLSQSLSYSKLPTYAPPSMQICTPEKETNLRSTPPSPVSTLNGHRL